MRSIRVAGPRSRSVLQFLAAALTAILLSTLWPPPSEAATVELKPGYGITMNYRSGGGTYNLGSDKIDGKLVYCLDIDDYVGKKYSTSLKSGKPHGRADKNIAMGVYVLDTYGDTTSNLKAAAVQLAVWYFLSESRHGTSKSDLKGSIDRRAKVSDASKKTIKAYFDEFTSAAEKNAPFSYKMKVNLSLNEPSDLNQTSTTGKFRAILTEHEVDGDDKSVTSKKTSVQVWNSSMSSSEVVKTKSGLSLDTQYPLYKIKKNDTIKVKAEVTVPVTDRVRWFTSTDSSKQRMVYVTPLTATVSTTTSDTITWKPEPTIRAAGVYTTASNDVRHPGDISDTAHVTEENGWFTENEDTYLIFRAYKISDSVNDSSSKVCDDSTEVFESARSDITQAGDVVSEEFNTASTGAGTYTWVATLYESDGSVAATHGCGLESETVSVHPNPTVSTEASDDIVLGNTISDRADVDGWVESTDTVEFYLYKAIQDESTDPGDTANDPEGTLDDPEGTADGETAPEEPTVPEYAHQTRYGNGYVCSAGNLVWSSEKVTTADGTGTYTSGEFTPTELGDYMYIEVLRDKDGNILDEGECGVPEETVTVNEPPAPTVTTTASDEVKVGETIFDTIHVGGNKYSVQDGDYVTVKYYKWSDEVNDFDAESVCAEENLLYESSEPIKIDNGPGDYTSEAFVTTDGGTGGFVESYYRAWSDEPIHVGECGEPSETVGVGYNPEVSTVASADGYVGDSIHDTIQVTSPAEPGSYVTVELFRTSDSTADVDESINQADELPDIDWAKDWKEAELYDETCSLDNLVWTSEQIPVQEVGEYTTAEYVTERSGTYMYVETLYDENGDIRDRGKCGEVSETVVIKDLPTVTTRASEDIVLGEGDLSDTVTVTDPSGVVTSIDVTLYRVSDTANEQPDGQRADACTAEREVATLKVPGVKPGDGEYVSESFTPAEAGTYVFVETSYDGDGRVISRGDCSDSEETVSVASPAPVPQEQEQAEPTPTSPGTPLLAQTGLASMGLAASGMILASGLLIGAGVALLRRKHG